MAIQQAGKPSNPRWRFPVWLRYIFIGLGLACLATLGYIWLKGVGSDLVNKEMTAIFVVLTAMFAFLAMPFLYRSDKSPSSEVAEKETSPAPTSSPPQVIIKNHVSQPPAVQLSPLPLPSVSGPAIIHESSQLDEDALFDGLSKCLPATFTRIVYCTKVPAGDLHGDDAPQTQRAADLIRWAKSNDTNLRKLHECYERIVLGKEVLENAHHPQPYVATPNDTTEEAPGGNIEGSIVQQEQAIIAGQPKGVPSLSTRRGCVEELQLQIKRAYDLLDPDMNILPEDIENAAQSLKAVEGDIKQLQVLLQENPPHPEHERILEQIRIINTASKCNG
jgi:hypothetical protein